MKPGQKVVCINTKSIATPNLIEGEIYTIESIYDGENRNGNPSIGIILYEIDASHPYSGFDNSRFRLVDYDFGEDVLKNINELSYE